MKFKKLETESEGNWLKRKLAKPGVKKSVVYILAGAVIGFLFFYLTEGMFMDKMAGEDIFQSILIGAFIGFFIHNSPCARGHC